MICVAEKCDGAQQEIGFLKMKKNEFLTIFCLFFVWFYPTNWFALRKPMKLTRIITVKRWFKRSTKSSSDLFDCPTCLIALVKNVVMTNENRFDDVRQRLTKRKERKWRRKETKRSESNVDVTRLIILVHVYLHRQNQWTSTDWLKEFIKNANFSFSSKMRKSKTR